MRLLNGVSRSICTEGERLPDILRVGQTSKQQNANNPCDIIWRPWERLTCIHVASLSENPSGCTFKSTPVYEFRSCSPAMPRCGKNTETNLFLGETGLLCWPTLLRDSPAAVEPASTHPSLLSVLGVRPEFLLTPLCSFPTSCLPYILSSRDLPY